VIEQAQATELSRRPPHTRSEGQRAFILAAAVAAVGLVLFTAWLALGIGGLRITVAVDDIGEAVAAAIAAAACAVAAKKASNRTRLGWSLLSAAALSWTAGEVVWSIYEVGIGDAVPFPSPADLGFLLVVPLAIAGLLALPLAPTRAATRARSVLDSAIVALSLLFVCWAFVLGPAYGSATSGQFAQLIGLAYPVGDVLIASVVIIIAGRASGPERARLMLLLGGFLAIAVADSAFAYLTGTGIYTVKGSVLDAAWVAGFLLIALAAIRPTVDSSPAEEGSIKPWQVALPTLAFSLATVSAFVLAASGHPVGTGLAALAASLGMLLVGSHLLSLADAANLRRLNHLAEAMMQRLDLALQASPGPASATGSEGRRALTVALVEGWEDNRTFSNSTLSKRNLAAQDLFSPGSNDRAGYVVGDTVADPGGEPPRTGIEARLRMAELEREP
jgi:diguanylate cyclase